MAVQRILGRLRRRVVGVSATVTVMLAGSMLIATPVAAQGSLGPLETVSTALDSSNAAAWWTPIQYFGGYTFFAFNTDILDEPGRHQVWVARRNPDGSFLRGCLKTSTGSCSQMVDDTGHNDPSIHIDGNGAIHVFANMHNYVGPNGVGGWIYYRSSSALDPTTLVDRSSTMPDQHSRYTYPTLTRTPNGDLWLAIRARYVDVNDPNYQNSPDYKWGEGRLYHWHNATDLWSKAAVYAKFNGATVYPDQLTPTPDGDVHITYEWCYSSAGGLRHQGSYLRYRPSTDTLYTAAGTALSAPATPTTPGVVYRPLGANEVTSNDAADGSSGIGLQVTNWPCIRERAGTCPSRCTGTGTPSRVPSRCIGRPGGRAGGALRWYGGAYDTTAALSITDDGTTKRIYYVKRDTAATDNAFASESVNAGAFTERPLAPGIPVHRLAAVNTADGTDHIYLATTDGPNAGPRGQLYYRTLSR